MRFAFAATCLWSLLSLIVPELPAREAIRLATAPALSPDGATLAFAWRGDIWLVSSRGGLARPWTTHPGGDAQPHFSPDGKRIAFNSDRTGTRQVYIGHVSGGFPTQVTFHSEGTSVEGWFPDGHSLLVRGVRDHSFVDPQRLFRVNVTKRTGEELLFDAAADDAVISPDGRKILFVREGVAWWRKGYRGSQASQIWLYDVPTGEFTKLVDHERGGCSPLWQPDGKAFYYVGAQSGNYNLWQRDLTTGKQRQLTDFSDDSVLMPCISRDGATIVFRHLFDFYRYRPGSVEPPQRLDIYCDSDVATEPVVRRTLESATEVSFSADGLELAMIAGGDLWVMDTELREPRQITFSPEEERSPAFAPDGKSILFVSDVEGEANIWRATRADSHKYWWQSDRFVLQRLTHDAESKSDLQWSPTGDKVAFVKGGGDLWIMDPDGQNAHRLLAHWDHPTYAWSPDGEWLTYAVYDNDFNRDVWVLPVDGSRPPVNLCWRTMRDQYYDPRLNNRNWDAIRRKYAPLAQVAGTADELATVVRLMLGELNGSHLGFFVTEGDPQAADSQRSAHLAPTEHLWKETTAHLGLRFDRSYQGPGCKVRDVIFGSPADHVKTKLFPGEIVLSINGKAVQPGLDLTQFLNGPPHRDARLRVRSDKGVDRDVQLRAITYEKARALLYERWIQDTEQKVAAVSGSKLGYLHIRSMDMPSFYRFERDLYNVGIHKEGLIIDVRENGGGSTTDHLLTALTQPVHAITVPRGGQPGYPQDRKVYATWNKPIVVLCNQNSFSNAEIFVHAVKTLGRGPVVGVPTAGGVLGTTSIPIMDVGRLRVPYRGWFLLGNGEDMDLNGAVPDYVVWPRPDEMSQGRDEQLAKAIEVLQTEVEKWSRRPRPALRWASQRERP